MPEDVPGGEGICTDPVNNALLCNPCRRLPDHRMYQLIHVRADERTYTLLLFAYSFPSDTLDRPDIR